MKTSVQVRRFEGVLQGIAETPAICSAETGNRLAGQPDSLWKAVAVFGHRISAATAWLAKHVRVQAVRKNLRVCETVTLGDRRFVAVIQVDGHRFLIGGGSGTVSLLSSLGELAPVSGGSEHLEEAETRL